MSTNEATNSSIKDPKKLTEEMGHAVQLLRDSVEKEILSNAEVKSMVDKMMPVFASYEEKNQELLKKLNDQQAVVDALERNASKSNVVNANDAIVNDAYCKQFQKLFGTKSQAYLAASDPDFNERVIQFKDPIFMQGVKSFLTPNAGLKEVKSNIIQNAVGDTAGVLIPPEFSNTLLRNLTERSPIRQLATVRQTVSNEYRQPIRNILAEAEWAEEASEGEDISTSQYNREDIKTKSMVKTVRISLEALQDIPFDMQSEIANDVTTAFAKAEEKAFINGNGVNQPEGLMSSTKIKQIVKSGNATALTADAFHDLFAAIKWDGYEGSYGRNFLFNRATLAKILQLKHSNGTYIWSLGNLALGIPNAILDCPYYISPHMPDIGANTYPILCGDFKAGYMIVDRTLMFMARDEVTKMFQVRFGFKRRLGASVVLPEAFAKMKIAAY